MKPLALLLALTIPLASCGGGYIGGIEVPELNPAECGCPDGDMRIKITIENGAAFCASPDDGISGDIWPVCKSDKDVTDTGCKVVEGSDFEKVVCGEQND